MLRITTEANGSRITLRLEGRLTGQWVQELERCWADARKGWPQMRFSADLNSLTWFDEPGAALLSRMASEGVKLETTSNLLMSALVEQIVRNAKGRQASTCRT